MSETVGMKKLSHEECAMLIIVRLWHCIYFLFCREVWKVNKEMMWVMTSNYNVYLIELCSKASMVARVKLKENNYEYIK